MVGGRRCQIETNPRSLVLITVDCLRADHVGWLGYNRPTTPFLDSLAERSIVFSNTIVAGAPTYYSFPAIVASRPPLALGRDVIGLASGEPTLATALQESGYATAAFLAGNPYLSRRFGYDEGFDTFQDFLKNEALPTIEVSFEEPAARGRVNKFVRKASHRFRTTGALYDEIYFQYCQRFAGSSPQSFDALRRFPPADVVVDQACSWLGRNSGRPFFLWLHFMEPHSPYYPCDAALEWMGSASLNASRARYLNAYWNRSDLGSDRLQSHRDEIIALYDAGIRWVDTQIARFVQSLREAGLWETCALAVTADHGEEFLEHGSRYHSPSQAGEELLRVPLLVHVTGCGGPRVEEPFSLLHLAPTLLDIVGAPIPATFRGRSYWERLQSRQSWDEPVVVESVSPCLNPFRVESRLNPRILVIRERRYKLVLDFGASTVKLFDLIADPRELSPLPNATEKPVRKRLLERAREHILSSLNLRDESLAAGARLRDLRLESVDSGVGISA